MKDQPQSYPAKPRSVGLVGFDGVTAVDLTGPLDALVLARSEGNGQPCYAPMIVSASSQTFTSESNLVFKAKHTLKGEPTFDTVIIPGGLGVRGGQIQRDITEWLVTHRGQFNRIVAVNSGIYPLAQSGLIDGRRVTTHWRFGPDLARRFPKVQVDQGASFLKDGPFYTCGVGTAAVELILSLIEEDYGSQVALSVARELGMRLRPVGEDQSGISPAQFECEPSDRLAELPSWIAAHLNHNLSVEVLAARACLCPRHFSRLFKRVFRSTPANFVETLRINEARRQLLVTRRSLESIGAAVGFASCDSFRRAFQRQVRMNPTAFRKQRFSIVGRGETRGADRALPTLHAMGPKQESARRNLHAVKSRRVVHA